MTQTMRERLAAAVYRELARQQVYVYSAGIEPPFPDDDTRGFDGFVVDGHLNGWEFLDAILAELSDEDFAYNQAENYDGQAPTSEFARFFTAMIDAIRTGDET